MFATFSTVRNFTLRCDAGDMPLTDIAFSPKTGKLTHVICDDGGSLFSSELAVSVSRLRDIAPGDLVWHADLSLDDIATDESADNVVPMENLPPIVVGPFGSTHSPLMLAAQWVGLTKPRTDADLPDAADRMGDWLGAVVFGPTGPIAQLADFHIDAKAGRVREVTLRAGDKTYRIPYDAIRSFMRDDCYAVIDLTEEDLGQGITTAPRGPDLPAQPRATWIQTAA